MGKTMIRVSTELLDQMLFEGAGDTNIVGASFDDVHQEVKLLIEGSRVPNCRESVVEITQRYRTVEIKPR